MGDQVSRARQAAGARFLPDCSNSATRPGARCARPPGTRARATSLLPSLWQRPPCSQASSRPLERWPCRNTHLGQLECTRTAAPHAGVAVGPASRHESADRLPVSGSISRWISASEIGRCRNMNQRVDGEHQGPCRARVGEADLPQRRRARALAEAVDQPPPGIVPRPPDHDRGDAPSGECDEPSATTALAPGLLDRPAREPGRSLDPARRSAVAARRR